MRSRQNALGWARRSMAAPPWPTDRALVAISLFQLREISDNLGRDEQNRLASTLSRLVRQFDPESSAD